MARYIDADKLKQQIQKEPTDGMFTNEILDVIDEQPDAEVPPERQGHVVWKERHIGGFRERKCLSDCGSIFVPSCNKIARIDDRRTENRPYCSKCGKLLGDYLSYCGNCGAKMNDEEGETNK